MMFNFGILNLLSALRNYQRLVQPVEPSISPIIDIAMKVNKIKQDDLQPLEALNTRMRRAFKMIDRLEINRHRTAVALKFEMMELIENRRSLIELKNDPPISTGTQTYLVKKPCRVRYVLLYITFLPINANLFINYVALGISFQNFKIINSPITCAGQKHFFGENEIQQY
jgi:hypothetical protein